jgi:phosphate transport system substrate-binding protein
MILYMELSMLKNRLLMLFVVLLLTVPFLAVQAQDKTIVEVAQENGSFTTLLAAVEAAGLTETLSGEGPFTVFAPTDEAFAALPAEVAAYLLDPAHKDLLVSILTYHVVSGSVMSADVVGMLDAETMMAAAATVQGEELTVSANAEGGVMVNQANVVIVDVAASNGVIHVVDSVLLPTITLPEVDPLAVEGDAAAAGSSTVFPLTEAVLSSFRDAGYAGNITVDSTGTGEIDFANASRTIREEETALCAALTPARTPIEFRVGTDALTIAVSGENDFVDSLTTEQVVALFGTAELWSDVDASFPAEAIIRYIPGTDSGTFDYFVEYFFDEDSAPILATNPNLSENDEVLVQGIESSPFAVGFFGFAYYQAEGDLLRAVALDGVTPNAMTAENGDYALARPLFIYTDAGVMAAKPQVASFFNYYLTNVNDIIGGVGYFQASAYELNLARLKWLANSPMMGM